jgi:AraC-like DNA-binding protein/mannose-6-phosphate isomerase-like protein (cupin superfamily)
MRGILATMTSAELDSFLRSFSKIEELLLELPQSLPLSQGFHHALKAACEAEALSLRPRFDIKRMGMLLALARLPKDHNHDFRDEVYIPTEQGFIFSLHPRFIDIPTHHHSYLELVYVYSGRLVQEIEGTRIELEEGDCCALDTRTRHSIGVAESGDIVVNCLMRRSYLEHTMASRLASGSPLASFLLDSSLKVFVPGGYWIIRSRGNAAIREVVGHALREQFDPGKNVDLILDACLCLLLAELSRIEDTEGPAKNGALGRAPAILRYLREHCATITLPKAADSFGLTPKYLGDYLRKSLGKSFTELVREARLDLAAGLLSDSDVSVETVVKESGYANANFFYRIFRERYGATPAEYRRRTRPK